MTSALQSLIDCGTKLWLDSIDPDLVRRNRAAGATGATSNPVIVSDLIRTGRFDDRMRALIEQGRSDDAIAWEMTDRLVSEAEAVFRPVWEATGGNDGYVSFELDPLLEDPARGLSVAERIERYVELGRKWSAGHPNRMIKVPATPAGIGALEELCASGITLNVTLIFSAVQYRAARDAVLRGAMRRPDLKTFKSVYSIFVSRLDVYTEKQCPGLTVGQGQVGIVNAQRIWAENVAFWQAHPTPLAQEMIFASTGTKKKEDAPWKYVAALAGSDIQTNPPDTNDAVERSGRTFERSVDRPIPADVAADIDAHVDPAAMEAALMSEGVKKFCDPQKALLALIADTRARLAAAVG